MTTAHDVIAAILGIDRESHQELVLTLHSRVEQQRQRAEAAEATIKELREQLRLSEQARETAERRSDAWRCPASVAGNLEQSPLKEMRQARGNQAKNAATARSMAYVTTSSPTITASVFSITEKNESLSRSERPACAPSMGSTRAP
jgi:hypothetical protein